MYTALGRFGFQMLVLLACVIGTWGGTDKTPIREVVELVSVVYKPARAGAPIAPSNAPAVELSPTSTSSPESSAAVDGSPKRAQSQPPVVVQDAKPSQEPAPTRPAKKKSVAAANEVKESCRPPACRSADHGKQVATKRTDTPQTRKAEPPRPAEPPVPAVFAPVRRLGLYLQAQLGVEPEGKAAP